MTKKCTECKQYKKKELKNIIESQQKEIRFLKEDLLKHMKQNESAYWVIDDLISQACYDILENKYVNQFLSAQEHAWAFMKLYYPEKFKQLYKDFTTNSLEYYEILCDPVKWKKEI